MAENRFEVPEDEEYLTQFNPDTDELPLVGTPSVAMERIVVGMNNSRVNASRVESIANQAEIDASAVDPDLKSAIRDERQGGIRRAAVEKAENIVVEMHRELESMRAAEKHLAPDVLRLGAVFDPDPTKHATQYIAAHARASTIPSAMLVPLAKHARASGNLAHAQLLLEQAMARKDVDRDVRAAVKKHVFAIPVPGAEDAQRNVAIAEQALEDASERLRRLKGERANGLAAIRRGLRPRAADAGSNRNAVEQRFAQRRGQSA